MKLAAAAPAVGWCLALLPLCCATTFEKATLAAAPLEHAPLGLAYKELLVRLGATAGKETPLAVEELIFEVEKSTRRALQEVERRKAALAVAYQSIELCSAKGLSNEDCGRCSAKGTRSYKALVSKMRKSSRRGTGELAAALESQCYASAAKKELFDKDEEPAQACKAKDFEEEARALLRVKAPKPPRRGSCRAAAKLQKAANRRADQTLRRAAQREAAQVAVRVAQRAAAKRAQQVAVASSVSRAVKLATRACGKVSRQVGRKAARKVQGQLGRGLRKEFVKAFALRCGRRRARRLGKKLARQVAPVYARKYMQGVARKMISRVVKKSARKAARKVARRVARMVVRRLPLKRVARTLARQVARKTGRQVHIPRRMVARAARMQVIRQPRRRFRFLQVDSQWGFRKLLKGVGKVAKSVGKAAGKVAGASVGLATGRTLGRLAGRAVGKALGSRVARAVVGSVKRAAAAAGRFVVKAAKKALPVVLKVVNHPLFPVVMGIVLPGGGTFASIASQAAVSYVKGKLMAKVQPMIKKAIKDTPVGRAVQKLCTSVDKATGGKLGKIVKVVGPALALSTGLKAAAGGSLKLLAKVESKLPPKLGAAVNKVAKKATRASEKVQAAREKALAKLKGGVDTKRGKVSEKVDKVKSGKAKVKEGIRKGGEERLQKKLESTIHRVSARPLDKVARVVAGSPEEQLKKLMRGIDSLKKADAKRGQMKKMQGQVKTVKEKVEAVFEDEDEEEEQKKEEKIKAERKQLNRVHKRLVTDVKELEGQANQVTAKAQDELEALPGEEWEWHLAEEEADA